MAQDQRTTNPRAGPRPSAKSRNGYRSGNGRSLIMSARVRDIYKTMSVTTSNAFTITIIFADAGVCVYDRLLLSAPALTGHERLYFEVIRDGECISLR